MATSVSRPGSLAVLFYLLFHLHVIRFSLVETKRISKTHQTSRYHVGVSPGVHFPADPGGMEDALAAGYPKQHTGMGGARSQQLSKPQDDDALTYHEYYVQESPSIIPSQEIVDDFHLVVKKYNEQLQIYDLPKHREDIPVQVSVMDRLWYALRNGTLPPKETLSSAEKTLQYTDHSAMIKGVIRPGSILEVGTGQTITHLSKLFHNSTCLGVISTGEGKTVSRTAELEGLSNVYIGETTPERFASSLDSLYSDPQVVFANLVISNLTSLVGNALPHEFEELIAKLISLSSKAFVIGLHPEENNRAYFEQSWDSLADLARKACKIGNLECAIRDATWTVPGDRPGWSYQEIFEITVKHGVRTIKEDLCQLRKLDTECELHFGNGLQRMAILYRDDSSEDFMLPINAVPLHALFTFGVTQYTRSKMFIGALNLPYSADICPGNLAVVASYVKNNFPKWSEEEDCENLRKIDKSDDLQKPDFSVPLDSTRNQEFQRVRPDMKVRRDSVQRNKFYSKSSVQTEVPGGEQSQLADSQVDGVAQGWNRVDIKPAIGTDGRGQPQQEEERQYQAMGKHWDRENIEGRSLKDLLQEQERKELARLAQAWDRELPADEVSHQRSTKGSDRAATVSSPKVTGAQKGKVEDAVLRRDEKELKRAMGFLHGDTDVKAMQALMKQRQQQQFVTTHTNAIIYSLLSTSTVTPTAQPRTSTTFSSSRFLSRPNRKSSTHPQKAGAADKGRKNSKHSMLLKFKPIVKPLTNNDQQSKPLDGPIKNPLVVKAELPHILHDDSKKQHQLKVEKAADVAGEKEGEKVEELDDEQDTQDGLEMGQDYVGIDKEWNMDDRRLAQGGNWKSQGGPPINYLDQPVENNRRDVIVGDMGDSKAKAGHDIVKLKMTDEDDGQQEDIPGAQELGDEHLYEEVKMNYEIVPDKTKRRLLAEDMSDNAVPREVQDILRGIPSNFRNKLRNAYQAKIISKGKPLGKLSEVFNDGYKNYEKETVEVASNIELKEAKSRGNHTLLGRDRSEPEKSQLSLNHLTEEQHDTLKPEILSFGRRHFRPWDVEEELYDYLWELVKPRMKPKIQTRKHPFNVLTYGSRSQSLIGLKLARAHKDAHVLSLMPTRAIRQSERQRRVIQSVNVDNIILLISDMTPALVNTLSLGPDFLQYQVLGMEIYEPLLQLRLGFPYYLGRLLSLATTSFVEVPDPAQLKHMLRYFTSTADANTQSGYNMLKGMVREALRLVNAENSTVTMLSGPHHQTIDHIKVLEIQIHSLKRPVQVNCGSPFLSVVTFGPHEPGWRPFSLHFLLEAGLRDQPQEKARLMSWYLQQSMHLDMCPLHIVWYQGSLLFSPPFSKITMNWTSQTSSAEMNTMTLLQREIPRTPPFSFIQYGSESGEVPIAVAKAYPKSSIFSLVDNNAKIAAGIHQQAKEAGLENMLVLNTSLNEDLMAKLLNCPEFLRYQHIDLLALLRLIKEARSRQEFDLLIGQMIATGATTFLELPSEQMLSLAMATFYPWSYSGKPRSEKYNPQMYHASQHPLPVYSNSEKRILGESAKADIDIEIMIKVIRSSKDVIKEQIPWSLTRIDVKNLTIEVDHHFDYQLDGHVRKYILHCESVNASYVSVWLKRGEDGFMIPYGNIHVISLIALLRMGLLEEDKIKFYDKFLNLPLYEDMAPWNIVFEAGNLTYIDYDSRNVTFNSLAPAAFQVISMLLNYERTVKDFGKCPHNAKIKYGIGVVGRCVGSRFPGPCMDNKFPVPCGDGSCKATYMDCLQALQILEHKKQEHLNNVTQNLRKGLVGLLGVDSQFEKDSWRFGINGIRTDNSKKSS